MSDGGLDAVRENRDELEDLVASDLPVSRVAKILLEAVDDSSPDE